MTRVHDLRPSEIIMTDGQRQYQGYAFAPTLEQVQGAKLILAHFGIPAAVVVRKAGVAQGKTLAGHVGDLYVLALAMDLTEKEQKQILAFQLSATVIVEALGGWITSQIEKEE